MSSEMTLAQLLGVTESIDWTTSKDYVINELRCSTCNQLIVSVAMETGSKCDLIFPMKVRHYQSSGHTEHLLLRRRKGEDANITVHSRGLDREGAERLILESKL